MWLWLVPIAAFLAGLWLRRWWLALVPVVVAIALIAYTVLEGAWNPTPSGDNEGAIAFLGIVVLALGAELALLVGSLVRVAHEKLRGNTTASKQAARAGGGVALVSLLFAGLIARLTFSAKFITVAIAAVVIAGVVVGLWRIARRWPG
ncbi:MAG: hypothetical protein WA484_11695 [Solirubrobacteraceae bacterium]